MAGVGDSGGCSIRNDTTEFFDSSILRNDCSGAASGSVDGESLSLIEAIDGRLPAYASFNNAVSKALPLRDIRNDVLVLECE